MTNTRRVIEHPTGLMFDQELSGRPINSPPSRLLLLALGCLLVAPSLLLATNLASSQAVGTSLAAMLAISAGLLAPQRLRRVRATAPWLLLSLLAITIHLLLASQFGSLGLGRAFGSIVLLVIFVLGAATLADLLPRIPPTRLRRLMQNSIGLLLGLGAWGCLGVLQPFGGTYPKPVFPFTEPSHFGLFLTPVLIAACAVSSQYRRIFYIGLALGETAILQNLTMAVGCAIAAIICLPLRHLLLLLIITVPAAATLDLTYYMDRVDFSEGGNINLSALVFLQGWQMLNEAWDKTKGFGLGFQQLGINGSEVDAALLIQNLIGDDQNLKDGGFNIAKIVSEFGIFGVAMILAYLAVAIKSILLLRSSVAEKKEVQPVLLLAASFIAGYALELAVRGAGYFTPTGLLVLVGLVIWVSTHKRRLLSRQAATTTPPQTRCGAHEYTGEFV